MGGSNTVLIGHTKLGAHLWGFKRQYDKLIQTVGKRSPVLGYNHNFKHRGLIFHVQTEDSGVDNPHLFTHLFHGGVIISSRRMDYDAASEVDVVKSLMQSQHKVVLKDLKIGTFDEKIDLYLGSNPELLPRKTDGEVAAPVAPSASDRHATIADAGPPVMAHEAAGMDQESGDTDDLAAEAEAAAAASRAYREQEATDPAQTAISGQDLAAAPELLEDNAGTVPMQMPAGSSIHLDIPRTMPVALPTSRSRIPTPVAVRSVSENELGDPMVTFSSMPRKVPDVVPPPAQAVVHTPIDAVGDNSGNYHMRRPNRGTAEQFARPGTISRSSPEPTPARAYPAARATGKAANPQPGRPRSSVVVSRPAVIIGAPPTMVGGDKGKQRAPAARKAREGNLFGKDLISEKSLDEVIMAYLSEDSSDD